MLASARKIESDSMQTKFGTAMSSSFTVATLAQLLLGFWRARLLGSSLLPALALAGLIALIGVFWFVRYRDSRGAALAKFTALVLATIGLLSAISAANAPLIAAVARISIPLFAFSAAAVIMLAEAPPRFQIAALTFFLLAVVTLEVDLTRDALWESGRL